jgi:hypothetical protein
MVFARSWKHPEDQRLEWRHGSVVCAEVLIPEGVPPRDIQGIYVSCDETAAKIRFDIPSLNVETNGDLFFR